MRKVESNQRKVKFSFCGSPVTVDKSAEWGEGNLQNFPNGVFLKHDTATNEITHGVQPNEEKTAPVGWTSDGVGLYKKLPIWLGDQPTIGTTVELNTLDGIINYEVSEESFICYNGDTEPDLDDSWIQSVAQLQKNYVI